VLVYGVLMWKGSNVVGKGSVRKGQSCLSSFDFGKSDTQLSI
jgi:hypothetical protein